MACIGMIEMGGERCVSSLFLFEREEIGMEWIST
jgi:hypothetical protein